MKKIFIPLITLIVCALLCIPTAAAPQYTVVKGDSMWKIAVKYEVGLSEIISANPHIKNPNLIYPGDILTIPVYSAESTAYEAKVIELINNIRTSNGLRPFVHNWQLSRVARYKSRDMQELGYFSHTSPTYGSPFEMIKNFNISYSYAGENIAKGYSDPSSVVNGWMNSSGHRANILNPSFTQIGVGYEPNGNYWTQMFIG